MAKSKNGSTNGNGAPPKGILAHSVTGEDASKYTGNGNINFLVPVFGGAYMVGNLPPDLPAVDSYQPFNKSRDTLLSLTPYVEGMWANALDIAMSKVIARGVQFDSPVPLRQDRMQDVFDNADNGEGFETYLPRHLRDFFTTANGAWTEIVRVSRNPGAKIVGFNHLDSLRVWRTNDPQTPAIYWDLKGNYRELRWWECFNICDMPSPRAGFWHGGICAAERAYRHIRKLAAIDIYFDEKITGGGFNEMEFVQGVTAEQIENAKKAGQAEQNAKGMIYYQGKLIIPLFGDSPTVGYKVTLKGMPDGWVHADEDQISLLRYAKALGIVPQDLDPKLTARGAMGVGQQSQVLDDAQRGYGSGAWEKKFVKKVNRLITPEATTMLFVEIDLRDDKQKADNRLVRAHARAQQVLSQEITPAQALYIAVQDDDAPREFVDATTPVDSSLADTEKPLSQSEQAKLTSDEAQKTAIQSAPANQPQTAQPTVAANGTPLGAQLPNPKPKPQVSTKAVAVDHALELVREEMDAARELARKESMNG